MGKHTPGPWTAYNRIGNRILQTWRVSCDEGGICQLDDSRTGDQQVANAHLIAAAPALLASLRELVDRIDVVLYSGYVGSERINAARAAIAVATGAGLTPAQV